MIRLFVLLVVILTIVWAKQSCYSCTSAADVDDLNGWYWGPYLSKQPLKMKFGSDYCNLTPWVAGGFVNDCHSKCFTWQYNYTDAKTKNPAYETIRGCASQVPDFPVPSSDTCQDILQSKGGPNSVGGPNAGPGYYSQCFCTGNDCNSYTRNNSSSTTPFSSSTSTVTTTVTATSATAAAATTTTIITTATPPSKSTPSTAASFIQLFLLVSISRFFYSLLHRSSYF